MELRLIAGKPKKHSIFVIRPRSVHALTLYLIGLQLQDVVKGMINASIITRKSKMFQFFILNLRKKYLIERQIIVA